VPASSLTQVHFPLREDTSLDCPEMVWDPKYSDTMLREQVLRLGREFRQSASNAAGGLPKAGGSA